MNKILIAVDDTKGTKEMFEKIMKICKCMNPEEIILLYVEKFEGGSLMDEMLGEAEMSELKKALEGTDLKKALDKKADKVLEYYRNLMQGTPPSPLVNTVVRSGHPAEEIVSAAKDKGADLIIVGTRGSRVGRLFIGSVSREVVNNAHVPVLVVK
jgi:nucleotide-binding universal stress UspA family protein